MTAIQIVALVLGAFVGLWGLLLLGFVVVNGLRFLGEVVRSWAEWWWHRTRQLQARLFGDRTDKALEAEVEAVLNPPRKSGQPNWRQVEIGKALQRNDRGARLMAHQVKACNDGHVMTARALRVFHGSEMEGVSALVLQRQTVAACSRVLMRGLSAPTVRLDPSCTRMRTGLETLTLVCGVEACQFLQVPAHQLPARCAALDFLSSFLEPEVETHDTSDTAG